MRPLWKIILDPTWDFPSNWDDVISDISKNFGREITMDGTHSTSRENANYKGSLVRVTVGDAISANAPWLINAYKGIFLNEARRLSGYDIEISKDQNTAIVINHLNGQHSNYERHVDTNAITGLLFVNTLDVDQGGELVFDFNELTERISPSKGLMLFFDGRDTPHYVSSLKADIDRITIPMNYYLRDTSAEEIQKIVPKHYAMGIKDG